jgi:hypothetical protein
MTMLPCSVSEQPATVLCFRNNLIYPEAGMKQFFAQSLCNSSCPGKRNGILIHYLIFQKYTKLAEFQITVKKKENNILVFGSRESS